MPESDKQRQYEVGKALGELAQKHPNTILDMGRFYVVYHKATKQIILWRKPNQDKE